MCALDMTEMEKLTTKIAALPPNAHYFSLEFFPPKTDMVCTCKYSYYTCANSFRELPIFELD